MFDKDYDFTWVKEQHKIYVTHLNLSGQLNKALL